MTSCWGQGEMKARKCSKLKKRITKMIKCMVKFSSGRLYGLKSPVKISSKHDWIRVKVDEKPR